MKKILAALLAVLLLLLCACAKAPAEEKKDTVLATTAPVAEIVSRLLSGTDTAVDQLITESVSCLHDYSLSVEQMKKAENCSVVVISGLGLEEFMEDVLSRCDTVIDLSSGIETLPGEEGVDPHIWMDPDNMARMTETAAAALSLQFPQQKDIIEKNKSAYLAELSALRQYGNQQLSSLSCRRLVTFHDGFSYFAKAFDLTVAAAMEIEPGSEPSAGQLKDVIGIVRENAIPAIFEELNGTTDAAALVSRELGVKIFRLSMAMDLDSESYIDVMKRNIDTIKEALG